uniref:Terpene synthase 6 n=1 Tax=Prunella vulgaris TaxID=39358 RepID=A0A6B7LF55_PRUVU|nr:terpene synthase 6 [Prunella vulgaris]
MISLHMNLCNAVLSIPNANKVATHRLPKLNAHYRTLRHNTTLQRHAFQPSAMMEDSSSSAKKMRPIITPFSPYMWGDIFSTFSFDHQVQQKYTEEIEELKKKARNMLMVATSTQVLILVDALERLGLAYHFEAEIEDKLKQIYAYKDEERNDDLFTTALCFRLLRQHQYHVSENVFEKFVEKDNKLKECHHSDIEGLLCLYEAAQVRVENENVLEEAAAFTRDHLHCMQPLMDSPLKKKVQHALKYPLHRTLGILTLRSHIDIYEEDDSRDELVLRLSKVNFNFLQNIYRNELFELTEWWNKLDLASKVPYFRDRLVECYSWALPYHFEPQYALARLMITKYYTVATALDDTYDNYATFEEIQLFTQALERLNIDEIEMLPHNFLKLIYKCILSFSKEFEEEAEKQGKAYAVPYYIEEMKHVGRGYALEQKWSLKQQIPSFQEYIKNTRITGHMYVSLIIGVTMIKSSTKETIDWVLSDSDIFIYASDVARLLDDLASHQRDSKDGTMLTCMDYYMIEKDVTMQEAQSAFKELIEENWKRVNAAWVDSCTEQSKEIVVQILDLARICEIYYKDEEDLFTYPDQKNLAPIIAGLFLDPILI